MFLLLWHSLINTLKIVNLSKYGISFQIVHGIVVQSIIKCMNCKPIQIPMKVSTYYRFIMDIIQIKVL